MDTLVLVIIGALVGVRARLLIPASPYTRFDHALIGGLATLLCVTLLELADMLDANALYGAPGLILLLVDGNRYRDKSIRQ